MARFTDALGATITESIIINYATGEATSTKSYLSTLATAPTMIIQGTNTLVTYYSTKLVANRIELCHKSCSECYSGIDANSCLSCSAGYTLTSDNRCACDILSGSRCLASRPRNLVSASSLSVISNYFDDESKRIEVIFNKAVDTIDFRKIRVRRIRPNAKTITMAID